MNLTCLIEVHDLDNLMRVRDHVIGFPHRSYSLLGINNRDLRTFKTGGVLVSESGIHTKADVHKLAEAGVRAVLVGESLMRSDDIGGKIRELFG
jgi:indole-3-glycerol phosphate synthase